MTLLTNRSRLLMVASVAFFAKPGGSQPPQLPGKAAVTFPAASIIQYEPAYATVSYENKAGRVMYASFSTTLEIERSTPEGWRGIYDLPHREGPSFLGGPVTLPHEIEVAGSRSVELSIADIPFLGTPGRYRARATVEQHILAPNGRLKLEGILQSDWVEVAVTADPGNQRILDEGKVTAELWRKYMTVLRMPDPTHAWDGGRPGPAPIVLPGSVNTALDAADSVIGSNPSQGIVVKCFIMKAVWEIAVAKHTKGAAAVMSYDKALELLSRCVVSSPQPPTGGSAMRVAMLRGICAVGKDDKVLANTVLEELERKHPLVIEGHGWLVGELRRVGR